MWKTSGKAVKRLLTISDAREYNKKNSSPHAGAAHAHAGKKTEKV